MITFRCAQCSILIQAHDGRVGRPVTCKKCQHVSICPPASILVPLRPEPAPKKPRQVGSPGFITTVGAIGLACLVWVIWSIAAALF